MKFRLIITIHLLTFFLANHATATDNNSYYRNNVYLELLGNTFIGSVNYDRILISYNNAYLSGRVGILPWWDDWNDKYVQDSILEIKFTSTKTRHHFIGGLGITHFPDLFILSSARVGYRYFSKSNHWFAEFSLIPLNYILCDLYYIEHKNDQQEEGHPPLHRTLFLPWLGLGLGYSF